MSEAPDGLVLRRATRADYEAAGEVTVAAYEPFTDDTVHDDYVARLADAASRDVDAELWVATSSAGELLGCVTICPPGSRWREIARDDEGEFRMLAVAPTAQGRGVGRALVELAVERFRSDGSSAIALSSLQDMTAAHALYERLGFARLPERDWRPRPEVALIAYRKEL